MMLQWRFLVYIIFAILLSDCIGSLNSSPDAKTEDPLEPRYLTTRLIANQSGEHNEKHGQACVLIVNFTLQCNCSCRNVNTVPDSEGTLKLNQIGKKKRQETLLLYAITAIVSSFFLVLAILAHLFLFPLNHHVKVLVCHAASLLVMNVTLVIRIFVKHSDSIVNNIVIFSIQYTSWLAAFFWLSVLAFDLWKTFVSLNGNRMVLANGMRSKKRWFRFMCAYAWGFPMLMCVLVIGISLSPSAQKSLHIRQTFAKNSWFQNNRGVLVFFYGPIIIILVANAVFFLLTVINLRRASHGTGILNNKAGTKLLTVYMKLFVLMGFCWVTEIITWLLGVFKVKADEAFWYLPNMINLSQGLFVFFIYVWKKKTVKLMKMRLCRKVNLQAGNYCRENCRRVIATIPVATIFMEGQGPWPVVNEIELIV